MVTLHKTRLPDFGEEHPNWNPPQVPDHLHSLVYACLGLRESPVTFACVCPLPFSLLCSLTISAKKKKKPDLWSFPNKAHTVTSLKLPASVE